MAKKRTKKHKNKAHIQPVNTQLNYKFQVPAAQQLNHKNSKNTEINIETTLDKKDLIKSLILALLIVISLVVIYWVSK